MEETLVKSESGNYLLKVGGGNYEYPIEIKRINTPDKLIGWIHHLCEKDWFTPEHCQQLIKLTGFGDLHA